MQKCLWQMHRGVGRTSLVFEGQGCFTHFPYDALVPGRERGFPNISKWRKQSTVSISSVSRSQVHWVALTWTVAQHGAP